uniref:Uncharacterized protein n=1 Tax=Triticum urartu TaxID=4572 RepID=A0A8R7VJZ5_TRIUA
MSAPLSKPRACKRQIPARVGRSERDQAVTGSHLAFATSTLLRSAGPPWTPRAATIERGMAGDGTGWCANWIKVREKLDVTAADTNHAAPQRMRIEVRSCLPVIPECGRRTER